MKRLTLTALLLIVLSTGAFAQYEIGSIGLYTSVNATDCDYSFTPYVPTDIYVVYYKSSAGPDGITAAEFRFDSPAGLIIVSAFTPSPIVNVSMGNISTGIALALDGCIGAGDDYVHLGTISVLATVAGTPMTMKILESTELTLPPYTPLVAICGSGNPIQSVLGGWFTAPDGTCNVGTEEKSWGAIKEMYSK